MDWSRKPTVREVKAFKQKKVSLLYLISGYYTFIDVAGWRFSPTLLPTTHQEWHYTIHLLKTKYYTFNRAPIEVQAWFNHVYDLGEVLDKENIQLIYFANLFRINKETPLYTTYNSSLTRLEEDISRVSRGGDTVDVWYGFFTTEGFATDSHEPYYTMTVD